VVFVYAGRLAEADVVPPEGRAFLDGDQPGWVEWRPVNDDHAVLLFPEGLQALIDEWVRRR
jgi:hypothetical protein